MTNPLKQFFRQPAIYLRLPSDGRFYPDGTLDLPPNKELPIYPMTAIDEITYRTPDALFNGAAVVAVIQSCVPNIKDAWQLPNCDLDTILTAIRIASYGHNLDVDTRCPHCENEATYGLDLRSVMDKLTSPDYNKSITYQDLEIHFKPMNYQQVNENNSLQFEEQKIISAMPDANIDNAEKLAMLNAALKKITEVTVDALAHSIASVRTPDALVTDYNHIREWLSNSERELFNRIKDHIIDLKKASELQPMVVKCANCEQEFKQSFTLDMANFFE
jgi:hypothetical protein